jgi:hypothetical protein
MECRIITHATYHPRPPTLGAPQTVTETNKSQNTTREKMKEGCPTRRPPPKINRRGTRKRLSKDIRSARELEARETLKMLTYVSHGNRGTW